jgi:SAM-dependent methyltransferase
MKNPVTTKDKLLFVLKAIFVLPFIIVFAFTLGLFLRRWRHLVGLIYGYTFSPEKENLRLEKPLRPLKFNGETFKSQWRRQNEGFFDRFCHGHGIDIGCGPFWKITPYADGYDLRDGDATYMERVPDESYDFVYASHILEHLQEPKVAIKNWVRICRINGYVIICVPQRDLYEQRKELPSRWNPDHKNFFLLDHAEQPCTLSLQELIESTVGNQVYIEYIKVCSDGWLALPCNVHPVGEYQIEVVLRKVSD